MTSYEPPSLEIIEIGEYDVLTASNGTPFLPYLPDEAEIL